MKQALTQMSDFTRRQEGINLLHLATGDYQFMVYAHPGKDATRTRRLVRKLMAPQMAAQANMLEHIRSRMTASERDHMSKLQEQAQALDGTGKGKEVEKELQALVDKYQDQGDALSAYSEMMAGLDLDQEEILDALAFKHTKVKCPATGNVFKHLSDDQVFNDVFMGTASDLVDEVRQEVFAFNGFLGKAQNATTQEPAQAQA